MVIYEDLWHSHLLPSFGSGAVTTFFYDLSLSRLGFQHPTFHLRGKRSNPLYHQGSFFIKVEYPTDFLGPQLSHSSEANIDNNVLVAPVGEGNKNFKFHDPLLQGDIILR